MTNSSQSDLKAQVLAIVREFLAELGRERALRALTIDATIEKDLGIGSLEKVELFHRIERRYEIQFSESELIQIISLNDIIKLLEQEHPSHVAHLPTLSSELGMSQIDPSGASTLVEVLLQYVREEPDRPHIYLQDDKGQEQIIRYRQLYEGAHAVAQGLYSKGLKLGQTVAIMLPTSSSFFYAFMGVLLAGGIPVPIYPPFRPDQIEEYAKREAEILQNAEARFLITFQKAETLSKLLSAFVPSLKEVTTVDHLMATGGSLPPQLIKAEDLALLQYTSGSTSSPKGVMLAHRNLLTNIRAYGKAIHVKPTDVAVSWLPLYHDMGLIGAWLGCFYHGIPVIILSPLTFLARPERWLWAIHYHRATISAGPNFAYELCIRKLDDKDLAGLDLSSWRLAFNGAEAVSPGTFERFADRFQKYGFKKEACFPVYGLAESTVALTFPSPGRSMWVDKVARDPLIKEKRAVPVSSDNEPFLEFVSCGKPLPEHEIRIVDDQDHVLEERRVGFLHFRGPSAMQGYYQNPQASESVYHKGWWDTGDIAYIAEGELFITGRQKDLIIKAGRNLYPEEIERVTAQVSGVRKGCVVAFGAQDPKTGTEKLVIVAESNEEKEEKKQTIVAEVIEKVSVAIGVPPDEVIVVHAGTIPKTSSGKLRRSSTKEIYLDEKLSVAKIPFWQQIMRFSTLSILARLKRILLKAAHFLYLFYLALVLLVMISTAWVLVVTLPYSVASKVAKFYMRLGLRVMFCPVSVSGFENINPKTQYIFVANHSSYVDSMALMGILPEHVLFVVKKELLNSLFFRPVVKKLKYITVDRLEFPKNIQDTKRIEAYLKDGYSIMIFPEGTFTYSVGLRPFKLGAFKVAVETQTPICPIAIQGTRKILGGGRWLPVPGRIKIDFVEPIEVKGVDWSEVTRLNQMARNEIAKRCGEFTLDLVVAGFEQKKPPRNKE